jgi:hypothetical protein
MTMVEQGQADRNLYQVFNQTPEERAEDAIKFVRVSLTQEGYLTDISARMILVELKRRGLVATAQS